MTLADKVTLARLGLTPLIVCAYLLLPVEHSLCFWAAGLLCGLAEYTDLADGRIARKRGEVSDFGKLADPFCDVIYRMSIFMVLLLPAGGVGYAVGGMSLANHEIWTAGNVGQLVLAPRMGEGEMRCGLAPWLPVYLMLMREIVAGALRAMTATKGLVLAARTSGKVKAWLQGIALISMLGLPAFAFERHAWHLTYAFWATWICALVSVLSILEYIWVNCGVLRQLLERQSTRTPGSAGR
jgi:CDP-diacylglycerol--glycerol-3-phosphate 3-phosphatidyltransferase